MSYEFRNRVCEDDIRNPGSKHVFHLNYAATGDTFSHDFLTQVTTLTAVAQGPAASALEGDLGMQTITVADASSFAVGTRYWIWDVTNFKFESFVCGSFTTGATETVTTTNTTIINGTYSASSIISSTPPLHDGYMLDYTFVHPGTIRTPDWVVLGNTTPAALDSSTVAAYTANFKHVFYGENFGSAELIIKERGVKITDSIGDTTKGSRFLGVVLGTNASAATHEGELVIYRKLLVGDTYTTLSSLA